MHMVGVQRVVGRCDLFRTPDEEGVPGISEKAPVGEHVPEGLAGERVVL